MKDRLNLVRYCRMKMFKKFRTKNKTFRIVLFFILSLIPTTSIAQDNPSISIELLSYEQKVSSYDDVPYCEISYIITNNSWGTLYGIKLETEAYDDRGTKLDDFGLGGKYIDPFSGWFDSQVLIRKGDMKQLNNLEYSGMCNFIKTINAIDVAPEDCNARMMPEDGSCFDVLTLGSSIDHISFQKK